MVSAGEAPRLAGKIRQHRSVTAHKGFARFRRYPVLCLERHDPVLIWLSVEVDAKNDQQSWGGTYYRTDEVLRQYFNVDLVALSNDAAVKPTKYSKSYKNEAGQPVLKILKPSGTDGFRPKDISVIVNKHVIKENYYSGLTLADLQNAANRQAPSPDRRA